MGNFKVDIWRNELSIGFKFSMSGDNRYINVEIETYIVKSIDRTL